VPFWHDLALVLIGMLGGQIISAALMALELNKLSGVIYVESCNICCGR